MTRKMRQFAALALAVLILLSAARGAEPTDPASGASSAAGTAVSNDAELNEINQSNTDLPEPPPADPGEALPEQQGSEDPYLDLRLRIGLAYGNNTLLSANLLNASTSPVSGYRFGFFDDNLDFVELGRTEETALTMLRTINIYRTGESYSDIKSASAEALGCYHLQMPGAFDTFEEAKSAADALDRGFVAWIDGIYYVRQKSFTSSADASEAVFTDERGTWNVVYTSAYSVNVVKTGTTRLLFQFDGLERRALGVMPGLEENDQAVTWFKGYKYYGGFRYERLGGGNLTVVNIVPLDTYVKGVVPYESYKQWPLETLKAQAMCAKNYALISRGKHKGNNFDLCTTTDCQVYHGAGSGNVSPSALSDQAVDEIRGSYLWYGAKLVQTYFYSSNGGGTEDVSNVWGGSQSQYPYLTGVVDPYEAEVADSIPNYYFSKTFTKNQLTTILREKGYASGTTVSNVEATYSRTGNVLTLKFTYANGKSNTFNCPKTNWLKNALGCRSIHFTVAPAGTGGTTDFPINGAGGPTVRNFSGLYALGADGVPTVLSAGTPFVITDGGTVASTAGPVAADGSFLVSGAGWGHNIGYSQWGGYAMALRGFTYDKILEFYFPGAYVGTEASDSIENI